MGESVAGASTDEHKMGERVNSNSLLEVSVSFGRFDNDSLSWEKWSSFSPNKYMEEVEKCATPGSVAKKKAYFEAHYKKIAARKAELLDQEKQMESESFMSNDQNCGDLSENTCGADSRFSISTGQRSFEEDKHENNLVGEFSEAHIDKQSEDPVSNIESQTLSIEGVKEDGGLILDSTKFEKPEEAALVHEEEEEGEIRSKRSQDTKEMLHNMDKNIENTKTTERSMNADHPRNSQKTNLMNNKTTKKNTPVSKERSVAGIKKKPVSPMIKAPEFSTPRVSKPKPTSTILPMSTSRSSTKKENVSTLPRGNQPSSGGSKKVAPKSLHMSPRLGPSGSDPASLTTIRKSFIMEKMGDKDIVKRAFKTFQSTFSPLKSPGDNQAAAPKQVPTKGMNAKVSTLTAPRREIAGSPKLASVEKKSSKSAPVSSGLKSNGSTEKQKEFSKKLEEKFNSRLAERTPFKTNPKETAVKSLSQSLNLKATPTRGLNQGGKTLKGPLDKGLWAKKLTSSTNSMGKVKNF